MPCQLQPWEIEYEENRLREAEKARNKDRFDLAKTDQAVKEEVICQMGRFIYANRLENQLPALAKAYLDTHRKEDAKAGRRRRRNKKGK